MIALTKLRLRLAGIIAPGNACVVEDYYGDLVQDVLEGALWGDLVRADDDDRLTVEVTGYVDELLAAGLLTSSADPDGATRYALTYAGERRLAGIWGPDRVPPWSGGYYNCHEHGVYDAAPGDRIECPGCLSGWCASRTAQPSSRWARVFAAVTR